MASRIDPGLSREIARLGAKDLGACNFAAHVMIATPLLLVELPFGEWSHAVCRPLALYLAGVRQECRKSKATAIAAAAQATGAE